MCQDFCFQFVLQLWLWLICKFLGNCGHIMMWAHLILEKLRILLLLVNFFFIFPTVLTLFYLALILSL